MKPRSSSKSDQPFDYLQKIIIIGDSGVGKSNILLRYSEGKFVENYMMTIGINYVYKIIDINGTKIKLQIWDTAGQDKYKTITKNYYRNSQGVLIVFSLDSRDSFYSVSICSSQVGNWMEDLTDTMTQSTQIILVGNKNDIVDKRQVTFEQASDLAKNSGMPYMQCSAKSGASVNEVFHTLGKMMKQKIIDITDKESQPQVPLVVPSRNRCCR